MLGGAQPFEYVPDALSDIALGLAASMNSPNLAAKMFGYDRKTFNDIRRKFKPETDWGYARALFLEGLFRH